MTEYSGTYEQTTFTIQASMTCVDVSMTQTDKWDIIKTYLMKFNHGASKNPGSGFKVSEILGLVPGLSSMAGLNGSEDWMILSITGRMRSGGIGDVTFTIRGLRKCVTVGCDFANFSRPIEGYVFPNEDEDEATERASRLVQWENMKTRDFIDAYIRYQYKFVTSSDTSTVPSSNASYFLMKSTNDRLLADKIKRGIESVDRYVPVVTLTIRTAMMPISSISGNKGLLEASNIGTQGATPSIPSSFAIGPKEDCTDAISEIEETFKVVMATIPKGAYSPGKTKPSAITWVITRDSIQTLSDLTYERRIQYTGFTDVDEDLYPKR